MTQDPRFKNVSFNVEKIESYLKDYSAKLSETLGSIHAENLNMARLALLNVRKTGGRIYAAGNGGSAAISEHLCCDWHKGVHRPGHKGLQVSCLTSNSALLTAVANDFGYDHSFSYQLEMAEFSSKDLAVLISSSGNSENVVQAAMIAKKNGGTVIGLTGFSGGRLKELSDISLHIPYNNYGLVEDAHQILMHVLAQFHDLEFSSLK
jgi:phosphoheptose isomerase